MIKSLDTQTNAKTAAIAEGRSFFLCVRGGVNRTIQ